MLLVYSVCFPSLADHQNDLSLLRKVRDFLWFQICLVSAYLNLPGPLTFSSGSFVIIGDRYVYHWLSDNSTRGYLKGKETCLGNPVGVNMLQSPQKSTATGFFYWCQLLLMGTQKHDLPPKGWVLRVLRLYHSGSQTWAFIWIKWKDCKTTNCIPRIFDSVAQECSQYADAVDDLGGNSLSLSLYFSLL